MATRTGWPQRIEQNDTDQQRTDEKSTHWRKRHAKKIFTFLSKIWQHKQIFRQNPALQHNKYHFH